MQTSGKPVQFQGDASGYFIATLVGILTMYIIIVGWPIGFNYMANWIISNTIVDGKRLKYSATYSETLGFLTLNMLLVIVTFGIYSFWFVPKAYRFALDHTTYLGAPTTPAPATAKSAPTPTPAA